MPTIIPQDRSGKIETSQTTQPVQADSAKERAIAAFNATTQSLGGSVIDSKAPPLNAEGEGGSTPQGSSSEESISQPSASNDEMKQLAARERAAWAEIKRLKAEKAELESKPSPQPGLTPEQVVSLLRTDPSALGLTYEDLGQMYLNKDAPVDPLMQRMQAKIEELEGKLNNAASEAQKSQESAYNQALKQIELEAKALVSKSDAYEVTRSQGAESAITKLIELTYNEEGILMDIEDAAAQVEAHLEQEAIALINRSQKLKNKLVPASPTHAQGAPKQSTNQQRQQTTLTPAMSQASPKPLSARDRAIAAFNKFSR